MILLGIIGPMESLFILMIISIIAGMWKIFEKANKPGWAAIVPLYNIWVLIEIIGKPSWWLLLWLIPYLNIIWSWNLLAKSFGKTEGYTVGIILLSFVFIPILGFGDAKYSGPEGLKK